MHRRHSLNYLYFGTLFVLIASLHILHVILVDQGTVLHRAFYITYAVLQALFEVGALVLIGAWVQEKLPKAVNKLFIIATFILLLIHLVDFPLTRLMDMSIWYSLGFIFAESFDNFVEMLKASNVHIMTWALLGVVAAALVCVGLFLFKQADRLSKRQAIRFSYRAATLFVVSIISSLAVFDYTTAHFAAAQLDSKFLKALPWKTTLFVSAYPTLKLPSSLALKPDQAWYEKKLEVLDIRPLRKPNIYLFVAESMREDFLTPEVAPSLAAFRKENLSFPCAVAAANATHKSWFSLFHSVYTFSWGNRQPKEWSIGSVPLELLKKAGYQIHVLSASELNYYQMDKILFGNDRSIASNYQVFSEHEAHENDAACISQLITNMKSAEEGHLFIVFFEATHFDYSWPPDLHIPSRPFASTIDYIHASYSKEDVEGIKNRYRHAIYHIDQQFNRFLTALKEHPKQEDAVVVFTSDHGEEFYEEERLFHASNLNRAQTRVPIYYKLPTNAPLPTLTSHLDIFPTLLDHVFGDTVSFQGWFDGESILRSRENHFTITTRFNASRTPYEFLITTEDEMLVARFKDRDDVMHSKVLEIISRKNREEKPIDASMSELKSRYKGVIETLLSH